MSLPSVASALRVPGNLCINPTQNGLASAFPHAGTGLGVVAQQVVHWEANSEEITAEEYGGIVTEVVYGGVRIYLAAFLRGLDNDALATIFPDTTAASVPSGSGDRSIDYRIGTARAGKKLSDLAVPLLFSPIDVERHRFVYFPRAIPRVEEAALLQLSAGEEQVIAVAFMAIPDANGVVARVRKREDLTL